MRELAKSMLSLSCALPLFGAQQALRFLDGSEEGQSRSVAAFEGLDRAMQREIGGVPPLSRLARSWQSGFSTLRPALVSSDLIHPSSWLRAAAGLARRSADGLRLLPEGNALMALREIQSKAEVFFLVLEVGSLIGVPAAPPFPLLDLVARGYALDPFAALWAIEGLGHDYADSFLKLGAEPRGILAEASPPGLEARSLLMLHAGIGLGFAQRLLDGAERLVFPELRGIVLEVVRLCRDNSRPGYVGAAYESLGLVTRTFHPGLVAAVDGILREAEPEVRACFWHGAGRAIYFLPVNFLPCSAWEIFRMARMEPLDELAVRNAVAGAAWAVTLVCQRDPQIMAELLVGPHGEKLLADSAFANGVAASVMMRQDTTPGASFLARFCEYQPDDRAVARLWEALVRRPCQQALGSWYQVLTRRECLGEIFHEQDLGVLVARLEGVP
jgi:hypothetical protein